MEVGLETPNPETSQTGSWVVETTSGKLLHLASLSTLHRWIVERRVGREDRLSRNDESGLRLGDVAELLPFFEIVDDAERSRGQVALSTTPLPAPLAVPVLQPPPAANRTTPAQPEGAAPVGAIPAGGAEQDQTVMIRLGPNRSLGLVKLLVTGAVAAVVAYLGILWQHRPLIPSSVPMTVEKVAPPRSVVAKVEEAPVLAAMLPGKADPPAEPVPAPGSDKRPNTVGKAWAVQRGKAVAAEAVPEQVKVEGSTAEPNSPQALAAQGYVALHRQKYIQAIRFFRLALMSNPPNGTALFGLAEGYRASGQHTAALRTYQRYVELMPDGPEVTQARAHIRVLESKGR